MGGVVIVLGVVFLCYVLPPPSGDAATHTQFRDNIHPTAQRNDAAER